MFLAAIIVVARMMMARPRSASVISRSTSNVRTCLLPSGRGCSWITFTVVRQTVALTLPRAGRTSIHAHHMTNAQAAASEYSIMRRVWMLMVARSRSSLAEVSSSAAAISSPLLPSA